MYKFDFSVENERLKNILWLRIQFNLWCCILDQFLFNVEWLLYFRPKLQNLQSPNELPSPRNQPPKQLDFRSVLTQKKSVAIPKIIKELQDQEIVEGDNLVLECCYTGKIKVDSWMALKLLVDVQTAKAKQHTGKKKVKKVSV